MTELRAFDVSQAPSFRLEADLKREKGTIALAYRLQGPLSTLLRASRTSSPAFTDELWKTTCFELFMQAEGQEGYEEWNFSPSGNWAHYHFMGYRQRIPDASPARPQSFDLQADGDSLNLLTQIRDSFVGKPLRFALTAVLHTSPDQKSYWAMRHARPQPDFHAAESFTGRA